MARQMRWSFLGWRTKSTQSLRLWERSRPKVVADCNWFNVCGCSQILLGHGRHGGVTPFNRASMIPGLLVSSANSGCGVRSKINFMIPFWLSGNFHISRGEFTLRHILRHKVPRINAQKNEAILFARKSKGGIPWHGGQCHFGHVSFIRHHHLLHHNRLQNSRDTQSHVLQVHLQHFSFIEWQRAIELFGAFGVHQFLFQSKISKSQRTFISFTNGINFLFFISTLVRPSLAKSWESFFISQSFCVIYKRRPQRVRVGRLDTRTYRIDKTDTTI